MSDHGTEPEAPAKGETIHIPFAADNLDTDVCACGDMRAMHDEDGCRTFILAAPVDPTMARLIEAVDDLLNKGADDHDLDRQAIEVTTWTITNLREARAALKANP